jgi:y4mF family transcriptional regulator
MRNSLIKLGNAIRQRRELLGLLQTQLAALSGISSRTIQLVEQGKGNPSLDTLNRLIDPLGLHLELMLKEPSKTMMNESRTGTI